MSPKPIDGQTVIMALMLLSPGATLPDPDSHAEPQRQEQQTQQIYGYQLMNSQERRVYQVKLLSLDTRAERQAFLLHHRQKMQLRASREGIVLPEEPGVPVMDAGGRTSMEMEAGQSLLKVGE